MSVQSSIISLDLRPQKGSVIDIASMFPFASTHAIRSTKPILDTLKQGEGKTYNFSLSNRLSLRRFRTIATLDLSTPELWRPGLLTTKVLKIRPRFHTIDLVAPLTIPYGSLDLRSESVILSERTYPDIFRRNLPVSLHMKREWKGVRKYLRGKRRSIAIITASLTLLTIPTLFFSKILIEDGYARLTALRSLTDRQSVIVSLYESRRDFERANILFFPFRLIPHDQFRLAAIAIDGGLALTRGIDTLVARIPEGMAIGSGSQMITESSEDPSTSDYRGKARDIAFLTFLGIDLPTDWLEKNHDAIVSFASSLQDAAVAFAHADTITDVRKDELIHISRTFRELSGMISFYTEHEQNILTMLGHTEPERYIIFNQNRDEIRANGGFPGSVITFTLYKGNILDYRMDDIYYYDWNLYPYKELPPPGLALLTDTYGLRDVNYYPDFRETLDKANAFVERSGDATITTGIAIHQGIVEDLLASIGPITLSGVSIPFTSENFSPLMSTLVEARTGEVKTSKDILFRFIGALAQKIQEKKAYDQVLDILTQSLSDGEILFASRDAGIDNFLAQFRKELPWECSTVNSARGAVSSEGELQHQTSSIQNPEPRTQDPETNSSCSPNWIYPVLTSVSGNKSDRYIHRLYTAKTEKINTCTYENKITLTHTHSYTQQDTVKENQYLDLTGQRDPKIREKMLFIEGNGKNRTYMRLYVPKGSSLTGSSTGIETVEKPEATVFTWLFETPIGSSTSKILRYTTEIPDCTNSSGGIEWIRQPGLQNTEMR